MSTPIHHRGAGARAPLEDDSRHSSPSSGPARQLNMTFERRPSSSTPAKLQATFSKPPLNATFGMDDSPIGGGGSDPDRSGKAGGNRTYDLNESASSPGGNATFTRRKMSQENRDIAANPCDSPRRVSRDSSHDFLEDERLSVTSDGSTSHRLNDVGDVQQLAKMQEESKRRCRELCFLYLLIIITNFDPGLREPTNLNHHRSTTISPSSEYSPHSPSNEGFNNRNNGLEVEAGYQQYSSQDSLPDSPYSSQSLDSQSAQGQGTVVIHLISCIPGKSKPPAFFKLNFRPIETIDAKFE